MLLFHFHHLTICILHLIFICFLEIHDKFNIHLILRQTTRKIQKNEKFFHIRT